MAVRGIGPRTVNYALMRGIGWLDGSPHGNAVRCGLQTLLGAPDKIDETAVRALNWSFCSFRRRHE